MTTTGAETEIKVKVTVEVVQALTDLEKFERKMAQSAENIERLTKKLKEVKEANNSWASTAVEMWDKYERSTEKALRSATKMAEGIAKGEDALDSLKNAIEALPGPFGEAAKFGSAMGEVLDKYTNIAGGSTLATKQLELAILNLNYAWGVLIHNLEVDRLTFKATLMLGKSQLDFDAFDAKSMFGAAESLVATKSQEELDDAYYKRAEMARYEAIDKAKAKAKQMADFDRARKAAERARLGTSIGYGAPDEDSQSVTGMFGDFMGGLGSSITGAVGSAGSAAQDVVVRGQASFAKQDEVSDRFLADLQDQTKATGAAFGALSAGMAASVEAAITGSQSIGQAFKNAAAAALKATAVESTIKALYHTAAGVGSLALGPIGGVSAAGHFKAAGLYAATALAAGAASAGLGGGGGGYAGAGAAASGGGGYSRPSAGGGGDGNAPINIYIGEGYVGDEKKLGNEIHRRVRSARRSGGARDSAVISHD